MNIPNKIDIIGHDVQIVILDKLLDDEKEIEGLAVFDADKILIGLTLRGVPVSGDVMRETFLHETLHHISEAFKAGLSEKQITCMARGLYSVLKTNKLKFYED